MRIFTKHLRRALVRAAITLFPAAGSAAALADTVSLPVNWLLPQHVHGSSQLLPGQRWEGHLTGERRLPLYRGLDWQTSTDLSRTRFEQLYPVRAQGYRLSTGPQIQLGAAELVLPWSTGRETHSIDGESTWSGGAPRMTVALGPNDRVRLEAKLSRHKQGSSTQHRRATSLSWRHSFSNDWSMSAGLLATRETGDADASISAQTWASVDARFANGWRWSLASRLSDSRHAGAARLQQAQRDRAASLSLSTRYRLSDGWWFSGELKSTQTSRSTEPRQMMSHSGGLKLFRDF